MAKAEKISSTDNGVVLSIAEGISLLVDSYRFSVENDLPFRPLEFLGPPGVGKTAAAKEAAKLLRKFYPDFQCVIIAPSTTPAEELAGIPMFNKRTTDGGEDVTVLDYALPSWIVTEEMDPNWKGFIVLDDARQCQGDQQKALANFIYERTMRGRKIPKGAMFVLTGNRIEDRAGVVKEMTHYSGRKTTIQIDASVSEWTLWAVQNGVTEEVIGYVNWQKSDFCQFDPNREKNPNSRTWEAVSNWMKTLQAPGLQGNKAKLSIALFSGEIGPGAATKFWAFCELFGKLPDPDKIIADPENFPVPDKTDIQYATTMALTGRTDSKTLGAVLTYATRISPEHAALIVNMSLAKDPALRTHKALVDWIVTNKRSVLEAR